MKALIPTRASSLLGVTNHLIDTSGTILRCGIPLIWEETEVDVSSIFQGVRGPRYSEKPVFHRKPVGTVDGRSPFESNVGIYLPCLLTYDCSESWMSRPGCTIAVQWGYSTSGGLFSRISYTIRVSIAYVDKKGVYRYCQLAASPYVGKNGWGKGSISYYPNSNAFPSGFASALRTTVFSAAITSGATQFIGDTYSLEERVRIGYVIKNIDYDAIFRHVERELSRFTSTAGYSPNFLTDLRAPTDPPPDLLNEGSRAAGEIVIDGTNYHHNLLVQRSFLSACNSVPRLGDNNISNIAEFVSFLYNLIIRRKVEIPQSLSQAWLSYRYQYKTTKGDIETAISFMRRHAQRYLRSTGLKIYGFHAIEYNGVTIQCRCTLVLKERELSYVNKIWNALDRWGLKPNFYIVWDMIPYSFVVDWFIPVGSVLEVWDASGRFISEHYEFSDIIYSMSYLSESSSGFLWKTYRRWVEKAPPQLDGYYMFEDAGKSKVWNYRALDATSLTLGGK